MCYMYWWAACSYQIGFMCTGEFNSVISDTIVSMGNVKQSGAGTQNHYLYFVDESADDSANEQQPEQNEDGEQENTRPGRPNREETEEETSGLKAGTPSGNGIIINPSIAYERYSDSDTYKQFVYDPN